MGSDRWARGRPDRLPRAVIVFVALVGALLAAPSALANLYTVNSGADTDNGSCDVFDCTLREAIDAANSNLGLDDITFQIGIGGSSTIQLFFAPLPDITESVTIDGTTQTGYVGAPLIEIDGTFAGPTAIGLNVLGGGTTIRGLAINNFDQGIALDGPGGNTVTGNYLGLDPGGGLAKGNRIGVVIYSPSNTIGGTTASSRNVISGNTEWGIAIGAGALNVVIANYVGIDASGSFAVPNEGGIYVFSDSNTIGTASGRNVVSGNATIGVILGASGNTLEANYIGTNADGTSAVPNMNGGVQILGGAIPANDNVGRFNVISGNNSFGLAINPSEPNTTQRNSFEQNVIGTDETGEIPLGNLGPGIFLTPDAGIGNNSIQNNTIAFNREGIVAGVGSSGNEFRSNSIHDNVGLGIDLGNDGVTANDPGDGDTGANELVNFPELATVVRSADGTVTVSGTYDGSLPSSFYELDFFASPACDGSGFGEGATFIGTTSNLADGSGDFAFNTDNVLATYVAPGSAITATATDPLGQTSELSQCLEVPAETLLTLTVDTTAGDSDGSCIDGDCSLGDAIDVANVTAITTPVTIAFDLPGASPFTITPTAEFSPITHDVVIDGTTQAGAIPGTPLIRLDGSALTLGNFYGLRVTGGLDGSAIRGLSITKFSAAGIALEGPPSLVDGNYVGLAPDGTAAGNGTGGFGDAGIIVDSDDNRVGGTTAAARNVISGNVGPGVQFGSNGTGNVILGNRIGTDPAGSAAVPNTDNGVHFEDAPAQTVGGTVAGAGNLISGNLGHGIGIDSGFEPPVVIQGNTIGLAADGATPLPNAGSGVNIFDGDEVLLGGATAGAGNVIAGNGGTGVSVDLSLRTRIQGNLVGLNAAGDAGVPNGASAVIINNSDATQVGGTTAGARNVISGGSSGYGVLFDSGSSGATVQGNYIGTDTAGEAAIGNGDGVNVAGGSQNVTIGGVVPGAGNVISGSSAVGVRLDLAGPGNRVLGNSIGTDKDETDVIPNDVGIELDGMANTVIGSTTPGGGNVIGGSLDVGILVFLGSDSNTFAGNFVGTDRTGTLDLGNDDGMRFVNGGGDNNLVGPSNVFAHNVDQGIELNEGTGNRISANSFHDNGGEGIFLNIGANNDQAAPTLASAVKTGATTTINGGLTSAASTSYFVEFFSTPSCSGQPQGKTYLGFQTVTTNVDGNASVFFTSPTPANGDAITATATSATTQDTSEFSGCVTVTGTGLLQGTVVVDPPVAPVDLTARGQSDWAIWGYAGGGTSTSLAPDTRKSGGSAISDLTNIDPAPSVQLRGLGQFPSPPFLFDWTDGDLPVSETNAQGGLQHNGEPQDLSTLDHGFAFDVPADTNTRTLKVYVATNRADGLLTATLSDASAAPFVNTLAQAVDLRSGVYTLTYKADSPGQTLHVSWIESADSCPLFRCDNAAIYAVALSDSLVVNTADDHDDGLCTFADCSLREAINEANLSPGPTTIAFAIDDELPIFITPSSPLPVLTDTVTIDGTTQAGYDGSPVIVLNGASAGGGDGLALAAGSDGSSIQGLVISNFDTGAGVLIQSDGNDVGGSIIGTTPSGLGPNGTGIVVAGGNDNAIGGVGARNVISGNNDAGVRIDGVLSGADGNTVAGNYIGLDPTGGAAAGNAGPGVWVLGATNTTIGGPAAGDGNAIAANFNDVMLGDFTSPTGGNNTTVQNNLLGLRADAIGSFPNSGNGVEVMDAGSNTIADNTIASTYQGIDICGSSDNTVVRNLIGSNAVTFGPDFGVFNQGISIFGGPCPFTAPATGNVIGGAPGDGNTVLNSQLNGIAADADLNTVSYNTVSLTKLGAAVQVDANSNTIGPGNAITGNAQAGVSVDGGTGNKITENSIDGNGRLGIDLSDAGDLINGITPNDPGDTDVGGNDLQNFPVVASAVSNATTTQIDATLDTLPGNYVIEVFSSPACDPSGNGEGATFLTQAPLNVSLPEDQPFTITLGSALPGTHVTMTATDSSSDNTSEFSNCLVVTAAVQTGPFVVNTNDDHDDTICDFADCTLREAMIAANGAPGSEIHFDLPGSTTITPGINLPTVDVPMTIDATTQPGYSGTPLVVLDGTAAAAGTDGFQLLGGGATIRGFVIVDWADAGISISLNDGNSVAGNYIGVEADGTLSQNNGGGVVIVETSDGNTIGGIGPNDRNVISGNGTYGIEIGVGPVDSSENNTVAGNYIGLLPDGTGTSGVTGNFVGGVSVRGGGNTIGGTTAAARNYISANDGEGILLQGPSNVVKGNTIGLAAATDTALPNSGCGITVTPLDPAQPANTIGDTTGGGNVISGNFFEGICVSQATASPGTVIAGNLIGTDPTGTLPIGNDDNGVTATNVANMTIVGNTISGNNGDGVQLTANSHDNVVDGNVIGTDGGGTLDLGNTGDGVSVRTVGQDNTVVDNTVMHNGGAGVSVFEVPPLQTTITANSIDLNTGLGIDLGTAGVTPNDTPDTDQIQNFPTLTTASSTSIVGSLTSLSDTTFDIDLYESPACDASGNGEGRTYLGTTTVLTNDVGNGGFTAEVAAVAGGHAVTATATDPAGNTSEFSACLTVLTAVAANLSLIATPASTPAGAPRVKLSSVPPSVLLRSQSSQQSAPVNQTPVNQTPVNQLAATAAPVNQTPINQTPVNQTPVNQTGDSGFGELTQTIPALGSISLSSIPLLRAGGWAALLAGTTLAGIPEQNVTLRDVYTLSPLPEPLRGNSVAPLRLGELDLSRSTLGRMPAMAFALGKLPLSAIPTTPTGTYTTWCLAALAPAVNCGSTSTVFSAGLEGVPVNQTPVNQTPVNQTLIDALAANNTPVNQTPVNQTPVNQTRIGALPVNQTPVNQTPVNQLSLHAILAANAPVNQTPVNQTPVNQLPVNQTIVNCTMVNCATATLGSAFTAGAINPGVTLGDLRAVAPAGLLASWTIADLRDYGTMTIGDLLASLPQPNTFTLADVLLLVLGSPNAQGLSFESLNLFDTGLPEIATGGSTVGYRAQFDVQASGGPSGVLETVAVTATLPSGFLYVPGSSKLTPSAGACGVAAPTGDPVTTTLGDGRLELEWAVDAIVGNGYAVCFTARPGIVLGPQAASLDVQPGAGAVATATPASVVVGDTLEPNDAAGTAPELFNDSFYLSYLTSVSDVDYARFAAPPAGTVMTFHLSHLPADYDLVVYGPPETQLRPSVAGAVPLDEPPVTDGGVGPTHATDPLASQTLDDLRLQPGLAMVGVSAMRGTDPDDVVVISQGTGVYTVQITGYNGATSPKPYMLRVSTTPPRVTSNVAARTVTGSVGPKLPALPAGLNTVFLVHRQQLEGLYGAAAASSVMSALSTDAAGFTNLGFPNVVLSVDRFASVQTAYAAWNANPGSPAAANGVVQAINGVLDQQIRSKAGGAGLKYLVIVGGDRVIPFARLDDFTVTASNEAGYASTFGQNSELFATLNAGMMLSDDPYGDVNPVPYLNRQLYIPELAVGRLVETPADIVAALNRFVSPGVQGHLDPTTALTTGYEFLLDGAQGVDTALRGRVGATAATTLLNNSWTLQNLTDSFLPAGGAPSITSLNGHASHHQFEPPANATGITRSPLLNTSDLIGSSSAITNRLVFSMGCHAGFSVADAIVTAGAPTLDWPQAFAQKGAGAFLGNTGYGYGDSLVVAYSEELNRRFAQRVAAGSTVGNALVAAKQGYYGGLGVFGVYDEKSMAVLTLYGLPMWSVSGPGNTPAPALVPDSAQALAARGTSTPAAEPLAEPLSVVPDAATGLDAETFDVAPLNTPTTKPDGTYWSAQDGEQVTHLRPIQPKLYVPLTGTTGHGALVTALTSSDTECVDPLFARPVVDLAANEGELAFGDVAFPSKLQTVRTFVTPTGLQQRVVLVTGQFFTHPCATDPDPQVGVQRLFSHIAGRVFRSSSADYIAPAFQHIAAAEIGGNAAFAVDVTDRTPTGAGQVKEVVVGVRSGAASVWTFRNLVQSAANPARWTGGAPISGPQFEYFVQAVDAAGNVGVSTNKGFYFDGEPAPEPPQPGHVSASLGGTPTNGWYTNAPTLIVDAPDGVTVEASIDGGPFGPPPASISGDGLHTIDLRGSNGDTARLFAAVDTTPPEIVVNTPANGGVYLINSHVPADYLCRDSGSGIVGTCTGTVPNGDEIDTSTPGTKTFTVNAVTDAAGRSTGPRTVTYTVGYCPPSGAPNVRWHYSKSTSGGWSATKSASCSTGAVAIGPQAMEGDLKLAPGATLRAGYSFNLSGNKLPFTVQIVNPMVVFQLRCASGAAPSPSSLTVSMPTQAYSVLDASWIPTGSNSSPLGFQGSTTVPNACAGGLVRFNQGGTFTAAVNFLG